MNHLRGILHAFLALICLTSTDIIAQTPTSGRVYSVESVTKSGAGKAADLTWKDGTKQVNLLQFGAGKVMFLNFWATWCPPCRKEIPDIIELSKNSPKMNCSLSVFLWTEMIKHSIPSANSFV